MSDFQERLKKAIERGERRSHAQAKKAREEALSEAECKRLHSRYRLQLSERIEACVGKLPQHFPGFQYETIYGDRGWGGACRRDDFDGSQGSRRANLYSRLEMTVRPYSSLHVLELTAKGTIRNKEVFSRKHFEELSEVDLENFMNLVDVWVLEYAEMYAAR
jgi:hypothetical protein